MVAHVAAGPAAQQAQRQRLARGDARILQFGEHLPRPWPRAERVDHDVTGDSARDGAGERGDHPLPDRIVGEDVDQDPDMAAGFDAARFGGPIGQLLFEDQERVLFESLGDVKHLHVLDLGTGTGRAAMALARRGAIVTGVDASSEMLSVARRRAAHENLSIEFSEGDAHALAFPDRVAALKAPLAKSA